MLLNDLFEALSDQDVAALMSGPSSVPKLKYNPLSPGSKRALQVRVEELEDKYQELKQYHAQLRQFMRVIPPELEQDLLELEREYKTAIEAETKALEDSLNQTKIVKFLNGIQNKCSDSVNAMRKSGTLLYRGTSYNQDVYIGKPHTSRRVMTSSGEMQKLYDAAIAEEGFKALRSNSIFTSGSMDFAKGFGSHIYLIFPVNGFDFTWSNSIRDIVIDRDQLRAWLDKNLVSQLWDTIFTNKDTKNRFLELVGYGKDYSDGDPDDDNIPYAYKKAYILEYDGFMGYGKLAADLKALKTMESEGTLKDVPSDLPDLISPRQIVDSMDLQYDDFVGALSSGHEICIHGTYYAISQKHSQLVQNFLKIG